MVMVPEIGIVSLLQETEELMSQLPLEYSPPQYENINDVKINSTNIENSFFIIARPYDLFHKKTTPSNMSIPTIRKSNCGWLPSCCVAIVGVKIVPAGPELAGVGIEELTTTGGAVVYTV